MKTDGYLARIGTAVLLGLAGGVFGTVYLLVVEGGIHGLWGEHVGNAGWFSAPVWVMVIPVVAGLLVGAIYHFLELPPRFKGFIDELEEGEVEPRTAPGAILVAIVSLIGGAPLGPEAPLGTGAGAMGTWLARRRRLGPDQTRATTFAGMSSVFGGLVSSPLGGPLIAFELEHEQSHSYYFHHLIPGVVAGAVGFGVMYPLVGAPLLGQYEIPAAEFESWMLLAAVGVGLVGAITALLVGQIMVRTVDAMRHLDARPILRGLVGGVIVAAVGFALPLTLFSGQGTLGDVLASRATIGLLTLLALIVLKGLALGASLGSGFYGGPIFPIFFIGGVLGILLNQLIPGLPLSLAVGGAMAAVGGGIALVPLSMTILASLLVGADFLMGGAILISAITGFVVRHMFMGRETSGDVQTAASAVGDRSG
jgi:H+/Cl- antiporter ClcA